MAGLYVATTFASALLLFLVQPLVAKQIVPWFGGVPAVWSLCLAFYQATLFAGYAYAHLLVRRASPRQQLAIHAVCIALAALSLPVLASEAWKPVGTEDPTAAVLAILVAHAAPPFFALAATGPLVAAWYARHLPSRSPYALYAVSNLGSLLALFAFPFVFERHLGLAASSRLWSAGFVATGAGVIACAGLASRDPARESAGPLPNLQAGATPVTPFRVALWIGLAACAVVLLMSVTNALCLDVASVPFLWIVPLSIYLASWILCFGPVRAPRKVLLLAIPFFATALAELLGFGGYRLAMLREIVPFQVLRYGLLLFGFCMALHGELFRLRPRAESLTAFYLCTSAGGAIGGLAVGLGAPHLFRDFYELPLGIALACAFGLAALRDDVVGWRWLGSVAIAAGASLLAAAPLFARAPERLHQERSFFGVLRVEESRTRDGTQRALKHGSTHHGVQWVDDPDRPTTYYGVHTGIGIALSRAPDDPPARIGIIGLGAGTLAAYGRRGDQMRFFEVDPAVIRIARDERYFRFLARSRADVSIVEGDGRITLARERARNAPRFDYLIVDAYSSDAIPVHLLTREALVLYVESLSPTGLLAMHLSSRHFDLLPLLGRLAADVGVHALQIDNGDVPHEHSSPATWLFLARSAARLDALERAAAEHQRALGAGHPVLTVRTPEPAAIAAAPLWTDDYSDLFGALRRRPPSVDRAGSAAPSRP